MDRPALKMPAILFFDGHCGLCHQAVLFTLRHDVGSSIQFAPLQGTTLREHLSPEQVATLPDSLVILDGNKVFVKSQAVLHLLRRMGGPWSWAGRVASCFPTALGDVLYDLLARIRHRLFTPPREFCPLVPAELRKRFLP